MCYAQYIFFFKCGSVIHNKIVKHLSEYLNGINFREHKFPLILWFFAKSPKISSRKVYYELNHENKVIDFLKREKCSSFSWVPKHLDKCEMLTTLSLFFDAKRY